MKRLMQVIVFLVTFFTGCAAMPMDTTTKHVERSVCFYGMLNPADLFDKAKYDVVKRDGKVWGLRGQGFFIAGFVAKDPKAAYPEVLAVLCSQGLSSFAYKHNGVWYAFTADPGGTGCFIPDPSMNDAQKETDEVYLQVFGKVGV